MTEEITIKDLPKPIVRKEVVTDPVTGMKFEIVTYLQESENLVIPYKWR